MLENKPIGLEHHTRKFTHLKLDHSIIKLHQKHYPDLKKAMNNNPNASNVYSYFLSKLPLVTAGKLTPEIDRKLMEIYKIKGGR